MEVIRALVDDPMLVQSMFFEGNPETWAHQDTYYLDSENLGAMAGVWFALEDIHPGAGRFYVYPGSHRIDLARNGGDFDIATNHGRYQELVREMIKEYALECHAPALEEGDILVWNSRTIHGSLATTTGGHTRLSLTAHYIPSTDRLLQFQSRVRKLRTVDIRGIKVHQPKDQDRVINRAILFIEIMFPRSFKFIKRWVVKKITG